ncbi:hypothetical protein T552_02484 [Pneumocystis carinii B80]|uniref:FAM192A/Fyv6 N-terminal domain-containing protein n=1 Tax=Pneumocystis carinii (strain B80) TaxID=1408658 RepID=A0A0W4ZF31_PNEC8|nr:hypothetical protein T552_02484 [Pneumocystis carinii B80]KTW26993.1 hypothetical protein T552_02484 [Pneumocystis carinii B80]
MKKLEGDLSRFRCERSKEWEEADRRIHAGKNPVEKDAKLDHRSLYEKLQANRLIKEEEYQESWKLSNLIRTLDEEEIDFLDKLRREKKKVEEEAKKHVEEGLKVFRRNVFNGGVLYMIIIWNREREQFDQSIQQSIYRPWLSTENCKSQEISERPVKKMKGMGLKGVILKKNRDNFSKEGYSESKSENDVKSEEKKYKSNDILSKELDKKNEKTSEILERIATSFSDETTDQKLIVYTSESDEREE